MPLLLSFLILLTSPVTILAGESLFIASILEDPAEFHLSVVTLSGTASEVTALEPYYIASGTGCYGAYTFTLKDESGNILIAVLGFCGTPTLRPPPIADGDRLLVRAHVHAPGRVGYLKEQMGMPILEGVPDNVLAVANHIERIAE